ncbi:helix-turn-helix domain-containing protein [Pseudomonas sp. TE3610]
MALLHLLATPAEIARNVGANVKQLRLAKNLSRKSLAERAGVSESSIKRLEVNGSISLEALILVALALDEVGQVAGLFKAVPPRSLAELKSAGRQRGTR